MLKAILLPLLFCISCALVLQVEPRVEECFNYDLVQNTDAKAIISVTRGGLLDIRYKVCFPILRNAMPLISCDASRLIVTNTGV